MATSLHSPPIGDCLVCKQEESSDDKSKLSKPCLCSLGCGHFLCLSCTKKIMIESIVKCPQCSKETQSSDVLVTASTLNDLITPPTISSSNQEGILSSILTEEDVNCELCFDIMLSPVSCNIGHSWCKSCINEWLSSGPGHQYCPTCGINEKLTSSTLNRNLRLEQMIAKFDVSCHRQREGCTWKGHRRLYEEHMLSFCKFRIVPCKYCHMGIQAVNITSHFEVCDLAPRLKLYANGDRYEGVMKNDKPNGQGICLYANGDVYDGQWKDGMKHGLGVLTLFNRTVIDGEFKDNKTKGPVILIFKNNDMYNGELKALKMHGQGVFTYANGDKLVGEFKNNKIHGQGVFTCVKGNVFEGLWANGKANGQGVYRLANGRVYEGLWKDGALVMEGVLEDMRPVGRIPVSLRIKSTLYRLAPLVVGAVSIALLVNIGVKGYKFNFNFQTTGNGKRLVPVIQKPYPEYKRMLKKLGKLWISNK